MGGFHLFNKQGKPCYPLQLSTIEMLIRDGRLELPSKEEIQDISKSNTPLAILRLGQTAWFLINCITRSTQSLSLTKLDILTVSYISVLLTIYIAWWDKPRNVTHPVRVSHNKVRFTGHDFPVTRGPVSLTLKNLTIMQAVCVASGIPDEVFKMEGTGRVPRFYVGDYYHDHEIKTIVAALLMGVVSAVILSTAWSFGSSNLSFAEMALWRACSLAIFLIIIFLVLILAAISTSLTRGWFGKSLGVLMTVIILFYIIARTILLILALMALRSLPPSAYETVHWTDLIPHI
jgi:hypothetical protein